MISWILTELHMGCLDIQRFNYAHVVLLRKWKEQVL